MLVRVCEEGSSRLMTTVLWICAGALVCVGVVLLLWPTKSSEHPDKQQTRQQISPSRRALALNAAQQLVPSRREPDESAQDEQAQPSTGDPTTAGVSPHQPDAPASDTSAAAPGVTPAPVQQDNSTSEDTPAAGDVAAHPDSGGVPVASRVGDTRGLRNEPAGPSTESGTGPGPGPVHTADRQQPAATNRNRWRLRRRRTANASATDKPSAAAPAPPSDLPQQNPSPSPPRLTWAQRRAQAARRAASKPRRQPAWTTDRPVGNESSTPATPPSVTDTAPATREPAVLDTGKPAPQMDTRTKLQQFAAAAHATTSRTPADDAADGDYVDPLTALLSTHTHILTAASAPTNEAASHDSHPFSGQQENAFEHHHHDAELVVSLAGLPEPLPPQTLTAAQPQ